jgi:hypothetical protein
MTLSGRHEEIVDDIREAWQHWKLDRNIDDIESVMTLEHCMAGAFIGNLSRYLRGDGYIKINDDYGPIILEVNHMRLDKWENYYCEKHDNSVRILRVSMSRGVSLMNPVNTNKERDFLEYITNYLSAMQKAEDV